MTTLTIKLLETDYDRLVKAAERVGKTTQSFIIEWISKLPDIDETYDVTQDPIFQMEGFDATCPEDLSINLDEYLYGEN